MIFIEFISSSIIVSKLLTLPKAKFNSEQIVLNTSYKEIFPSSSCFSPNTLLTIAQLR